MALPRPFSSYLKPRSREEEEEDRKAYECYNEIISTWQTQEKTGAVGHYFDTMSRHRDSWYCLKIFMPGVVAVENHFKSHRTDVLLASFPKTGTTWAKALLFSAVHCRGSRDLRLEFSRLMAAANPHGWVPMVETLYCDGRIPDLEAIPPPRLFHTHIPKCSLTASVVESGCRIVYVWRDPKDTLVSAWYFLNNGRKLAGMEKIKIDAMANDFMEGLFPFGSYWDHVVGYWKYNLENPGRVLFLRYEEMVVDPVGNLKKLADFLGKPFSAEEDGAIEDIVQLCSIDSLKSMAVNKKGNYTGAFELVNIENASFFRNGKVGESVTHLPPEVAERIDHITRMKFGPCGLLSH